MLETSSVLVKLHNWWWS